MLPVRNYSEIAVFMDTMIPSLAAALVVMMLAGAGRAWMTRRVLPPTRVAVSGAILAVVIAGVVGSHFIKMLPLQRSRAAHWGTRFVKTNKNWGR